MTMPKMHIHPIATHFSNGLIPTSLFFLGLYFVFREDCLETMAFYLLAAGTAGSCVALLTGMVDHKMKFKGAWVPIFKKKIGAALGAVLGGGAACGVRYFHPGLIEELTWLTCVYFALLLFVLGCVTAAGHWGGKLVFKK